MHLTFVLTFYDSNIDLLMSISILPGALKKRAGKCGYFGGLPN